MPTMVGLGTGPESWASGLAPLRVASASHFILFAELSRPRQQTPDMTGGGPMCQPVFCYSGYVEEKFSSPSQSMVTWLLGLWGYSTSWESTHLMVAGRQRERMKRGQASQVPYMGTPLNYQTSSH